MTFARASLRPLAWGLRHRDMECLLRPRWSLFPVPSKRQTLLRVQWRWKEETFKSSPTSWINKWMPCIARDIILAVPHRAIPMLLQSSMTSFTTSPQAIPRDGSGFPCVGALCDSGINHDRTHHFRFLVPLVSCPGGVSAVAHTSHGIWSTGWSTNANWTPWYEPICGSTRRYWSRIRVPRLCTVRSTRKSRKKITGKSEQERERKDGFTELFV